MLLFLMLADIIGQPLAVSKREGILTESNINDRNALLHSANAQQGKLAPERELRYGVVL